MSKTSLDFRKYNQSMWLCIGCFCDCGEYDGVDDVHDNKYIKFITDDINIGLEYLIFLFVVVIKCVFEE